MKSNSQDFREYVDQIKDIYAENIVADPQGSDVIIPDNQNILEQLTREIRLSNRSYEQQGFAACISALDKRIGNLPVVVTVRHHLATWSKSFIAALLIGSCITVSSAYWAIRIYAENNYLEKEAEKYQYVEFLYPNVAQLINYEFRYRPERLDERVSQSRQKIKIGKKSNHKPNLKTNEK